MNNDDRLVKKYFLLLNFNPQSWIEDIYFWGATVICFILTKSLFLEIDVETRFWDEPQVLSLFLSLQCLRMGVFNFMEPIVCIPGCKAGWIFFFLIFEFVCFFACLLLSEKERRICCTHCFRELCLSIQLNVLIMDFTFSSFFFIFFKLSWYISSQF